MKSPLAGLVLAGTADGDADTDTDRRQQPSMREGEVEQEDAGWYHHLQQCHT